MKFGFVTCVELGLSCIKKIYEIGGELDVLITLHDHKSIKKSGRIYLDDFSKENQVPLFKINHINDIEVVNIINRFQLDWLFIIGWSQIAGSEIIFAPKRGAIGAHPTLLPQGRGRAAIPWAILKGLTKTGVTFFKMDENVDQGPILAQLEIAINENEDAGSLYEKVNKGHEVLIEEIFISLKNDTVRPIAQDESKATYWPGRTPADGELFPEMATDDVDRIVRATTRPYPGAFIIYEGTKIIIWKGEYGLNQQGFSIKFKDGIYTATDYTID